MICFDCVNLLISLFSTFCVLSNSYFDICAHIIGIYFFYDFCLHYSKVKIMRTDMIFHHIFALLIVTFYLEHNNNFKSFNPKDKYVLIKNILSVEVSTIFFSLMRILPKKSIYNIICQILFMITFAYTRLYHYVFSVVLSRETHVFLAYVAKSDFKFICVYVGIYGVLILNIYWSFLIAKKLVKLMFK